MNHKIINADDKKRLVSDVININELDEKLRIEYEKQIQRSKNSRLGRKEDGR